MLDASEYLKQRVRPQRRPVMYQRWRDLLFVHGSLPTDLVQSTLPAGLTVDSFPDETGHECAWVGLVPFRMEAVRPVGLPPVPKLSFFLETNLRTYVHREGRNPGVWFYNLEASDQLACTIARNFFGLPYFHAKMSAREANHTMQFASERTSDGVNSVVRAKIGEPMGAAVAGSRDYFFVERYLLYTLKQGKLLQGRVHHAPYQLSEASLSEVTQNMVQAVGLPRTTFDLAVYSPSVTVSMFPLTEVS